MHQETTYRGLSRAESATAARALEKGVQRLERLLDEPVSLRAVVEGGPETRANLTLNLRGGEVTSSSTGHDLNAVIFEACDKLKVQLVRKRHRRESQRHRPQKRAATA